MAEEQRGHRLCANNCGFFGSPTTLNLCSKCYKDHCMKQQQSRRFAIRPQQQPESTSAYPLSSVLEISEAEIATRAPQVRCATCRKRVGLTGFKCRCGVTFCGSHRYPEHHGCTFDYKSMGRVAIAMANPLVKGEKLHKI